MFPPKAITNIPPAMKCLCSSATAWKANLASYVPLVIKVEGHFGGAENKGAKKKSSESYFQKTHTLKILEIENKSMLDKLVLVLNRG